MNDQTSPTGPGPAPDSTPVATAAPREAPAGDRFDTHLARAFGAPVAHARIRTSPEDFVVEEVLGFTPSGAGEHWWLTVKKRGRNTQEVADTLARFAGVPGVAVGFAGLKDRQAVTTQTFTVQVPGKAVPDWQQLADETLQFMCVERHDRKLRRGTLKGNRFAITLRDVVGDPTELTRRVELVAARGVPNYFGEQRFGREARNLERADAMLSGRMRRVRRNDRSLWLSAARSHLFNRVLSARVRANCWDTALPGDVLMFAGSHTQIRFDAEDPSVLARISSGDLHPTGPLPGQPSRALAPEAAAGELEGAVLGEFADWLEGLARARVDADRRPCRLRPEGLEARWGDDQSVTLTFGLDAGSYATTLIAEIADVE